MRIERRIDEAARFALDRHTRSIDLIVGYFHEASVLVLVFGLLDTYSSNRLDWSVARIVCALAFLLFVIALGMRWLLYRFLRIIFRFVITSVEAGEEEVEKQRRR
jgi:hypothetical protein